MNQDQFSLKCPFRQPLISHDFGCLKSKEVTFRDGPGICCIDEQAQQRCKHLFTELKTAALPAFEVADDLTEMPASILVKIQYGGLIALAEIINENNQSINDIHALVAKIDSHYPGLSGLDYQKIVPTIKQYSLRRRRKR